MSVRLLFLLVLGVATLWPPTLAQAEQGAVRDARGDAKAPWDITRVVADNGESKLRIQVHYRGRLRPKHGLGLLTQIGIDVGDPAESVYDRDFVIDMLRGSPDPQAPNRFELVRYVGYDVRTVRCGGLQLRTRDGQGLLEFVVPQDCFGALAGPMRLTGYTYTPRGAPDEADYIRYWGPWLSQG
jgi:hypothetical protein